MKFPKNFTFTIYGVLTEPSINLIKNFISRVVILIFKRYQWIPNKQAIKV